MEEHKSNPSFKPIATRKIYQYILEQFVHLVSTGVLKPGDKIPSERELAESFKVSRPSVREALQPMGRAIGEMRRALLDNDVEAGALADIQFHRSLLLASNSFILQKVLE